MLKAARVGGTCLAVVDLMDLMGLNWDQQGATQGRDAEATALCVLCGENCLRAQQLKENPCRRSSEGQPSFMHYAGVKFNKRMGNDTWRPGFIKEDTTGRRMFSPYWKWPMWCRLVIDVIPTSKQILQWRFSRIPVQLWKTQKVRSQKPTWQLVGHTWQRWNTGRRQAQRNWMQMNDSSPLTSQLITS